MENRFKFVYSRREKWEIRSTVRSPNQNDRGATTPNEGVNNNNKAISFLNLGLVLGGDDKTQFVDCCKIRIGVQVVANKYVTEAF